ncbi:ATPase [Pseudomonas sp. Leaf48]|uniref:AAA family ATPase n=1 Tax=Pseudomonas sp. Leaf48 TaxID=1736221 RepID=UPI000725895E|nr:AAA family ATPase [Pseudomonas sp. Leaf48]KQN56200.1 ATPase [Pseudomonas sp. Leaf48]
MTSPALNQILFGPPGTGKTFATIEAALEILAPEFLQTNKENRAALKKRFDELAADGHVEFVTFHQSFSYEDFVEGLRAESGDDGQLRYDVVDGVFKNLCTTASAKVTQQAPAPMDIERRRVWKMSLGNIHGGDAYIFDECKDNNYALLGYGGNIDFSGCESREDIAQRFAEAGETLPQNAYGITAVHSFLLKMKIGDLLVVTEGNTKFRAIGEVTGEYRCLNREDQGFEYGQCRSVKWLRIYEPSLPHDQLMNGKFTQRTLYELSSGSLDRSKLAQLLGAKSPVVTEELGLNGLFKLGESFGTGYVVTHASDDIVELSKPKGNQLPVGMSILSTLAGYVREGRLSIADIRNRLLFKKVPETKLDPHLVNGYLNILPALVERLLEASSTRPARAAIPPRNDARVLIIDEINRGNISRIFGELITLIEPSKRAGADEALIVTLPYSKQHFSIPSNVYLIGTMNTADRSLSGLDIALRRRFTFREMPPKPELLENITVGGLCIGQLLKVMNQRIEMLLDRDHCLGHAYFMPLDSDSTLERLGQIFREQVLPLLQEYFFEDWQRIQWVLNDHRKSAENCFIEQPPFKPNLLFGEEVAFSNENNQWMINEEAFARIESYWGIIDHQAVLPKLQDSIEAEKGDIQVRQLESGSVEVLQGGKVIRPSKPLLRELAAEHSVTTHYSSGRELNTRQLGVAVIRALKGVTA